MKSIKIAGAVGLLFGICLSSQATISMSDGTGPVPGDTPITSYSFTGPNGVAVTCWVVKDVSHMQGALSFFSGLNPTGSSGGAGSVVWSDSSGGGQLDGALVVNTPTHTFWVPAGSYGNKNPFVIVPEASTLLAGTLLLIPFAATTLRIVRKR